MKKENISKKKSEEKNKEELEKEQEISENEDLENGINLEEIVKDKTLKSKKKQAKIQDIIDDSKFAEGIELNSQENLVEEPNLRRNLETGIRIFSVNSKDEPIEQEKRDSGYIPKLDSEEKKYSVMEPIEKRIISPHQIDINNLNQSPSFFNPRKISDSMWERSMEDPSSKENLYLPTERLDLDSSKKPDNFKGLL